MFHRHPSKLLNAHFQAKPYQGANPEHSRFLFVGLDANYSETIEQNSIFKNILLYHEDGPRFWTDTGVHHPFVLPSYKGDGRRYHVTFAKIGFQPKHAQSVSFIELLHCPTVGRSKLVLQDLDPTHLELIHHYIFAGKAKYIFISSGVLRLMSATKIFRNLGTVNQQLGALRVLYEDDDRAVFLHLHFSNYGKFELQLQAESRGIAELLEYGDT